MPRNEGAASTTVSVGDTEREDQLKALSDLKLEYTEDDQLKIIVGGREIPVPKQSTFVNKTVNAIIHAEAFIGSAISAEPHAGLAWAGVSVLLPASLHINFTFVLLCAKVCLTVPSESNKTG
jgi:hypothetical protein